MSCRILCLCKHVFIIDNSFTIQAAKKELASVEEKVATQTALLQVRSESMQTINGTTSTTLADKQRELELIAQQVATERSKLAGLTRNCRDTEVGLITII